MRTDPLRVVIVEDSAVTRHLLERLIGDSQDFEVEETVADGRRAVERVVALRPDVVTMDIHLPGIDGIEATRRIMRRRPTPVLVVSASSYVDGNTVFEALQAGALGVVRRPLPPAHPDYSVRRLRFFRELRAVAGVRLHATPAEVAGRPPGARSTSHGAEGTSVGGVAVDVIGIAASTGGPSALRRVLVDLRGVPLPPIVVVQHMSPGFLDGFALWLSEAAGRPVRVAVRGGRLVPNEVVLAPDDRHLLVTGDGRVRLDSGAAMSGHRPSADVLFESMARTCGPRAIGVVLTGMGQDGAEGLTQLRRSGAITLGQDRATSVVYGMPAAAAERGAVGRQLPVEELGGAIEAAVRTADIAAGMMARTWEGGTQ